MYNTCNNNMGFWSTGPTQTVSRSMPRSGLGQWAAVASLGTGLASVFESAWNALERFFSIGEGRSEADIISPVANSLTNPQGTGRLDEIVRERDRTTNLQTLQNLIIELNQIERAYDSFLSDPRFTDGRASAQARNDMMPLIDAIRTSIENKVIALGGEIPGPGVTQGYGATYPTLRYPTQTYPWLPQAGSLPTTAPLPEIYPSRPQEVSTAGIGGMLPMLLLGGLAFTVISRKRR